MQTLIEELSNIVGARNVLSGDEDRRAYDHDWTHEHKGRSLAVVRPASTEEVAATLRLAHRTGTPVIPQGGNTGLVGGCFAGTDGNAIILNLGRMTALRMINPVSRVAIVEAGVILQALNENLADQGLIFPMSFGAKGSCQIGGMLSTNAGGSNAVRYGTARANCLGIEVVAADGRVLNLLSELRKDNTGYDLRDLFIGAEGTLGVITAAVLKLAPLPPGYATALCAMTDVDAALALLTDLQDRTGGAVEAFEFMPETYFPRFKRILPDKPMPLGSPGQANIMVEIAARKGETPDAARAILETALEACFEAGTVLDATIAQNDTQRRDIWAVRESAYEVTYAEGPAKNHDVSVPLDKVGLFLTRAAEIAEKHAPGAETVEVSHLGDGNIHYPVLMDPTTPAAAALTEEIDALVAELSGSFSAEHGIGLNKLKSMARGKDPASLDVMRTVKQALDPKGILNPGKFLP